MSVRLPVAFITSFIGREQEIVDVTALVGQGKLLTLTGPGGIGKTRLAREVVRRAQEDSERAAAWVALSAISDPRLVVGQVALALGSADRGAGPTLEVLAEAIGERIFLLVIDDCEHLIEPVASLVEHLLAVCPGLTILATSREALGVPGERTWVVPSLSLPDDGTARVDAVVESEAVRLFVDRARDAVSTFVLDDRDVAPVSQICRRLDGIPLAIELAAARIRALTPKQIAERLDDAFELLTAGRRTALPRHRTLRATVEWSYRLLSPSEQVLFHRLSVFRGGSTLEAIEAVCADAELPAPSILQHLVGLVARSVVRMEETGGSARYALLETVRRYGEEMLEAAGTTEDRRLRRTHAQHFLSVAERAAPRLERQEFAPSLLAEFTVEHDNFTAALRWAEANDPSLSLRGSGALAWFWVTTGHWQEGAQQLDAALAHRTAEVDPRAAARALTGRGSLAFLLHDLSTARQRYQEAVEHWRGVDEPLEVAKCLAVLAQVHAELDETDRAIAAAGEAVSTARARGGGWPLAWVLACVGSMWRSLGRLEDAERAYEEAELVARDEGASSVWLLEVPLGRALVAWLDDAWARAAVHAVAAVRAARSMNHAWYGARALLSCVAVASRIDAHDEAARLLGALSSVRREDVPLLPHEKRLGDQLTASVRNALGEAALAALVAEGRDGGLDAALERAETWLAERLPPRPPSVADVPYVTRVSPSSGPPVSALRVLALGPLEILRFGQALPQRAWRYAKPRELLLYLLCHPRGRTREQIGVAFWPEAPAARVKNNLHVALHRLRSALEHPDWVTLERGAYRLHPQLEVDFDADRFEEGVTAALKALTRGDDPAVRERLRQLLTLYRGDFLEAEGAGDWHLNRRDRLRRLFVEGQSTLAHTHLDAGALEDACDAFERLVSVDELGEEAYRGLMIARARMGNRAEALRLYQRLTSRLREHLDSEPAPETVALADRLRRSQSV